jgi:isopentenyl-diphosphate delta-isomerase
MLISMTGGTNRRANSTGAAPPRGKQGLRWAWLTTRRWKTPLAPAFQVACAPNILLFANLGAVQLNYGYTVDHCRRAVDMLEADAVILHLNALQEAVQPEGDANFSGLLKKIEAVCRALPVPVIAKEVGWGISTDAASKLALAGVAAIDVAGAGDLWSQVEMHRAQTESQKRVAAAFIDWGLPTAESIENVRRIAPQMKIIASGGLRDGVEVAKCLALGATLGGLAVHSPAAALR